MKISVFSDTEVAFAHYSDKELRRASFLFTIIGKAWIVSISKRVLYVLVLVRFPVGWFVKPVFKHFCGGLDIVTAGQTSDRLAKSNVFSILDYSVENTAGAESHLQVYHEVLKTIDFARYNSTIPFVVFKPSALIDPELFEMINEGKPVTTDQGIQVESFNKMIEGICRRAAESDVPVLIDAEDFCFQNEIDRQARINMEKFNTQKAIVYNTFQMYRWDRREVLQAELRNAKEKGYYLGVKLVRGAYMEKERLRAEKYNYPSPINESKAITDAEFNWALEWCLKNRDNVYLFCGTHNEESNYLAIRIMEQEGILPDDPKVWFAQLFGMSDNISFNLAANRYNVAKYVPYGPVKEVLPYLLRRADENTSVAGQSGRELLLLQREIHRRKLNKRYDIRQQR